MDYFLCFTSGFFAGVLFMGYAIAETGKTKDYMMIDGKMKWIKRMERFKEELEALKQSRINKE